MPDTPSNLPGKGLLGWLGRQVGYVNKAVKARPVPAPPAAPKVIYRDGKIEEAPHPTEPGVTLRRTIIDEVVVDAPPPAAGARGESRDGR
jgi:hypothetical protein